MEVKDIKSAFLFGKHNTLHISKGNYCKQENHTKKINTNLTKKDRLELITNLHISCMMFAFYHTLLEKQCFPIEEKRKHLRDLEQEIKSSQGH